MSDITISEFLDTDYKKFAFYVLENRAIPGIDGLKPVQRKILFAISAEGNQKIKVNVLSGKVIYKAQYHHGNVSCEDAIVNMAQKFKNNLPILDSIGIYGSLRNPYAASSRYISTKLSNIYDSIFKDDEILNYNTIDGIQCEPLYYLPVIPMVLINGSSGIAVGFSTNILNRDPIEVIDRCLKVLSGGKISNTKPLINEFSGEFIQDNENPKRWIIRGKFEITRDGIKITELPPSFTYESYEKILDKLVENKTITDYKNNSKSNIDYQIKVDRKFVKTDENIYSTFKLVEYETEIFTTLDETGKLKIFESDVDIINYFVNFRLNHYSKRKEFHLAKMKSELTILSNKGRFIKAILDDKIEVKNQTKDKIVQSIEAIGLDRIEDSYDYLLRMPIWSLTKDLFEKLKQDFKSKKDDIENYSKIDPKDMYVDDLNQLKKKIKSM
jgi:DNA topoisomerase-2